VYSSPKTSKPRGGRWLVWCCVRNLCSWPGTSSPVSTWFYPIHVWTKHVWIVPSFVALSTCWITIIDSRLIHARFASEAKPSRGINIGTQPNNLGLIPNTEKLELIKSPPPKLHLPVTLLHSPPHSRPKCD
jgi:hypothetical protein